MRSLSINESSTEPARAIVTGTVCQRSGDAAWYGNWRFADEPRWRKVRLCASQDAPTARAELARFIAAKSPRSHETLGAFFKWHLDSRPRPQLTRETYAAVWRLRCAELDPLVWSELTPTRLSEWLARLVRWTKANGEPLSPSSIHVAFALVGGVLKHAVDLEILTRSPLTAARRILPELHASEANSARRHALTAAESQVLINDESLPLPARLEYRTQIFLCLRPGELRALRFGDLKLDAPTPYAHIRASSSRKTHEGKTKNRQERAIPIHSALLLPLLLWHSLIFEREHGRDPTPRDLVFPSRRGGLQSPCLQRLQRHLAKVQLPIITQHDLRHTGATLYRAAGVPIEDVGFMMGHDWTSRRGDRTSAFEGARITEHYAHVSLPALARQLEKLVLPRRTNSKREIVDNATALSAVCETMPHAEHPITGCQTSEEGQLLLAADTSDPITATPPPPRTKGLATEHAGGRWRGALALALRDDEANQEATIPLHENLDADAFAPLLQILSRRGIRTRLLVPGVTALPAFAPLRSDREIHDQDVRDLVSWGLR